MGLFNLFFGGNRRGGRNDEYTAALREIRKQKSKLYRTIRTLVIFAGVLSVALLILSIFVEDLQNAWLYKGIFIVFALCVGGGISLPWINEFERDRSKAAKGEQVAAWRKYVVFVGWGVIALSTLLWIISVIVIGEELEVGIATKDWGVIAGGNTFTLLRSSSILTIQVAVASVVAISTMRFGKENILLRAIIYITLLYLDVWLCWFIGGVEAEMFVEGFDALAPISSTFLWVTAVLAAIALIVASAIYTNQIRRKEIELFMNGDVDALTSADVDLVDAKVKPGRNEAFGSSRKTEEKSPEQQLEKIKELLDKGIITEEEYQQKRRDIIDKM